MPDPLTPVPAAPVVPPPPPSPSWVDALRGWAVAHRVKIGLFAGACALTFVCPVLPPELRGPCTVAGQALRAWEVAGVPLP